jgi:hypothetical protein
MRSRRATVLSDELFALGELALARIIVEDYRLPLSISLGEAARLHQKQNACLFLCAFPRPAFPVYAGLLLLVFACTRFESALAKCRVRTGVAWSR